MQKKVRLNAVAIVGVAILLILIVLVRAFQEQLFYDPLLAFFKTESKELPEYNSFKLFGGLAFRYFLNAALSLGIIYLVFKDRAIFNTTTVFDTFSACILLSEKNAFVKFFRQIGVIYIVNS